MKVVRKAHLVSNGGANQCSRASRATPGRQAAVGHRVSGGVSNHNADLARSAIEPDVPNNTVHSMDGSAEDGSVSASSEGRDIIIVRIRKERAFVHQTPEPSVAKQVPEAFE